MKKLPKRKKIVVDNHIKAFGEEEGGKIKINVAKHKGDKKELADTVFHESYHAKHPKATEKKTYKVTRKAMKTMPLSEKDKLVAKVKGIHQKQGALKRKFKMGCGKVEPGAFLKKYKELKTMKKSGSNERLGIMGLV